MLSSMSRVAPAVSRVAKNRVICVNRRTMLALSDQIKSREKVEEDRYMRAQTEAWKEKLRKLKAEEESQRQEQQFQEVVKPVMDDVADMLAQSGDKVSPEALETLAKWKIDL